MRLIMKFSILFLCIFSFGFLQQGLGESSQSAQSAASKDYEEAKKNWEIAKGAETNCFNKEDNKDKSRANKKKACRAEIKAVKDAKTEKDDAKERLRTMTQGANKCKNCVNYCFNKAISNGNDIPEEGQGLDEYVNNVVNWEKYTENYGVLLGQAKKFVRQELAKKIKELAKEQDDELGKSGPGKGYKCIRGEGRDYSNSPHNAICVGVSEYSKPGCDHYSTLNSLNKGIKSAMLGTTAFLKYFEAVSSSDQGTSSSQKGCEELSEDGVSNLFRGFNSRIARLGDEVRVSERIECATYPKGISANDINNIDGIENYWTRSKIRVCKKLIALKKEELDKEIVKYEKVTDNNVLSKLQVLKKQCKKIFSGNEVKASFIEYMKIFCKPGEEECISERHKLIAQCRAMRAKGYKEGRAGRKYAMKADSGLDLTPNASQGLSAFMSTMKGRGGPSCTDTGFSQDFIQCKNYVSAYNSLLVAEKLVGSGIEKRIKKVHENLRREFESKNMQEGVTKKARDAQIRALETERDILKNNLIPVYSTRAIQLNTSLGVWPREKNVHKKRCKGAVRACCRVLANTHGAEVISNENMRGYFAGLNGEMLQKLMELNKRIDELNKQINKLKGIKDAMEEQNSQQTELLAAYCETEQGQADTANCGQHTATNTTGSHYDYAPEENEWGNASVVGSDTGSMDQLTKFTPSPKKRPQNTQINQDLLDSIMDDSGGFLDNPSGASVQAELAAEAAVVEAAEALAAALDLGFPINEMKALVEIQA